MELIDQAPRHVFAFGYAREPYSGRQKDGDLQDMNIATLE